MSPGQARDKQIARLTREERLGALPLSLANGRRVKVGQLRSFSRVVGARNALHLTNNSYDPIFLGSGLLGVYRA